jgi:hypothetical protein
MLADTFSAWGALPLARLDRVHPVGIARGSTTDITLEGNDLEGVQKILLSDERLSAEAIDGGKFRVHVPADFPLGMVDIRAVGTWGASNPRTLVVAKSGSLVEAEPNDLIEQAQSIPMGSAVEGVLQGRADVDYFAVTLEANQSVVIELEAERIDSTVDGVLTVFAPDGRAIELSNAYSGKDPRIDLVAPVAGSYRVRVHDLLYNGGPGYYYRLRLHQEPTVDLVYPPVAVAGQESTIELWGRHLPGSTPAPDVTVARRPLERLTQKVTLTDPAGGPLSPGLFLRPRAANQNVISWQIDPDSAGLLSLTDVPVVTETEPNDADPQANPVMIPADIAGRLDHIQDTDTFRFQGTKDQLIEIAGVSERIGSPADLTIFLRRITAVDAGTGQISTEDVAEFDDDSESVGGLSYITSSHDPLARIALPADGEYLLTVRDRFAESRGDGRFVYHVRVGPPVPDFQLLVAPVDPSNPSSLLVRSGGTSDAMVYALRRGGFAGEIQVAVDGLPPGVTATPVVIGPGQNQVSMVFQAAGDAADAESRLAIRGTARVGDRDVVRWARAGTIIFPAAGNAPRPARLARSVVLAVRAGAPYLLTSRTDYVRVGQGAVVDLGLSLERRSPDFTDKLAGVTIPTPPGTFENAVTEIPAGQSAGSLSLYVKPETPPGRYSLSVKGTAAIPFTKTPADPNAKKSPLEVADPSPPIEITVVPRPAELVPASAEPSAKPGQSFALGVKVNRQNGYTGPIELSLRLPPGLGGISTPVVTLPADLAETIVPIQLASDLPVGDKGGITVRGTAKIGSDVIPIDARIVLKVTP